MDLHLKVKPQPVILDRHLAAAAFMGHDEICLGIVNGAAIGSLVYALE